MSAKKSPINELLVAVSDKIDKYLAENYPELKISPELRGRMLLRVLETLAREEKTNAH